MRNKQVLYELLEDRASRYEQADFIADDPICIPHGFSKKEDAEIAGFLTATIAWGQRKTILRNAQNLIDRMDGSPHKFITSAKEGDLKSLEGFIHRTFNDTDLLYFVAALKEIYLKHGGLERVFTTAFRQDAGAVHAIHQFRQVFFSIDHPERTGKHVADPMRGSSAKRINMFLRWMVRSPHRGVDLGLWKDIRTSDLCIPLDVHTGNVARELKLLKRVQNDWKSVEELMSVLRKFDPEDPVKYDFALFGMGVYEGGKMR